MRVTDIHKTCQVIDPITVKVDSIADDVTDDAVVDFALRAVGETRNSLFGIYFTNCGGYATVIMYRD